VRCNQRNEEERRGNAENAEHLEHLISAGKTT
jgi:hypothetical protein